MPYITLITVELFLKKNSTIIQENVVDIRHVSFLPSIGDNINIPTNIGTDDKNMKILKRTHSFKKENFLFTHVVEIKAYDTDLYIYKESYGELVRK